MKNNIPLIIMSFLVVGCSSNIIANNNLNNSTTLSNNIVHITADGASAYASGVRWNDNYIVTVKHLTGFTSKEKCDSDNLDVAFIKRDKKSYEYTEKWTNPINNEKVLMTGSSKNKITIKIEGSVVEGRFPYKNSTDYKLVTGKVRKGMSGGPIKNHKDEVVGIIIGYTLPILLKGKEEKSSYSVMLPFESIQKEWENIQSKIDKKECFV